ncbi:winged helix-turn-helix domain-containing protein [Colwellia sp. UCD-KL20]|uniref:winged helix-turn-helix domain-containing protein n=1 Tax=Colwellia sp. UCD-KL20 TaxID=1917165 RepID=UPI000970B601|nr:winged helix-turn-helix domain-containing protein [Colwellia sp. UCD-KL20]
MTNKFENNKKEKTVAQTKEINLVDEDGVVLQTRSEHIFKIYAASEPHYIKNYQQCFESINDLKNRTEEILNELLIYTEYNKNTIYLNQQIKVDICNKLGTAYQTMTNALTELKKSQILLYIGTGLYIVNPYYFGKGEWRELKKIRDKIKISTSTKKVNGRTIQQYDFDYSELSNQFFDKDKLKTAKPKKPKNLQTDNSDKTDDLIKTGDLNKTDNTKLKNTAPSNSIETNNTPIAQPWYKKLSILSWCFKH